MYTYLLSFLWLKEYLIPRKKKLLPLYLIIINVFCVFRLLHDLDEDRYRFNSTVSEPFYINPVFTGPLEDSSVLL